MDAMELFFTCHQTGDAVREIVHEGRKYLVAPVVAIREGVLNEQFVPGDEIGRYVAAWNGIPVPIGHPRDGAGTPVSANTPDLVARAPGRFWNARFEDNALKGEIWLDVERVQALGGDAVKAMARLREKKPVEVSTAYFHDVEPTSGQYGDRAYRAIAHNLRPDHLAILLDVEGACSWADGCGAPRVNQANNTGVMVAFTVSDELRAQIQQWSNEVDWPAGTEIVDPSEYHVTLAYLGQIGEIPIKQEEFLRIVGRFAQISPAVPVRVEGITRFTAEDGQPQPVVLSLSSDVLDDWRARLVQDLLSYEFVPQFDHGFNPHVTLAYMPAGAPMPDVQVERIGTVFDRVSVAWGNVMTHFDLQGEVEVNQRSIVGALKTLAKALGSRFGFSEEGVFMNKQELIEGLVANERCPLEAEELEQLEVCALQRLQEAFQEPATNEEEDDEAEEAPQEAPVEPEGAEEADEAEEAPQAAPEPTGNAAVLPGELVALSKAVKELGGVEAVRDLLQGLAANASAEKAGLVTKLAAVEACAFSKAELGEMSVNQLQKLAKSLMPGDYAGRPGPQANQGEHELDMPALFEKEK